jgi:hypothetical protein
MLAQSGNQRITISGIFHHQQSGIFIKNGCRITRRAT